MIQFFDDEQPPHGADATGADQIRQVDELRSGHLFDRPAKRIQVQRPLPFQPRTAREARPVFASPPPVIFARVRRVWENRRAGDDAPDDGCIA